MPERNAHEPIDVDARLRRVERKLNVLLVIAAVGLFWPLLSAAAGILWWVVAGVTVVAVIGVAGWLYRERLPSGLRTGVEAAARRGLDRATRPSEPAARDSA